MVRKKTKGKATKPVARKKVARATKTTKPKKTAKTKKTTKAQATPTASPSLAPLGAIDRLRGWSPSRYSRR